MRGFRRLNVLGECVHLFVIHITDIINITLVLILIVQAPQYYTPISMHSLTVSQRYWPSQQIAIFLTHYGSSIAKAEPHATGIDLMLKCDVYLDRRLHISHEDRPEAVGVHKQGIWRGWRIVVLLYVVDIVTALAKVPQIKIHIIRSMHGTASPRCLKDALDLYLETGLENS